VSGEEKEMEAVMIEVTVYDVLGKVAAGQTLPQVDARGTAAQQAEEWLVRLSAGNHRVILLEEKGSNRMLPIWVSPADGEAAAIQLQGRSPIRPLTFDLVKELLAAGDVRLESVAVNRLHEHVFYGTLTIQTKGSEGRKIDCRPSDAINLALRMEVPIYVAADVLAQEGVRAEERERYDYLPCESEERWVSLTGK
jgi:bifunctional DNase/RNase